MRPTNTAITIQSHSIETQARLLTHQRSLRQHNRQLSMLVRAAAEVGTTL
ncbi:MAG: hypothetical protein HC890_03730 [Chloroflexaceae bacterium]|nr:hypothetical protein [Chloroflexaceae bacterium]